VLSRRRSSTRLLRHLLRTPSFSTLTSGSALRTVRRCAARTVEPTRPRRRNHPPFVGQRLVLYTLRLLVPCRCAAWFGKRRCASRRDCRHCNVNHDESNRAARTAETKQDVGPPTRPIWTLHGPNAAFGVRIPNNGSSLPHNRNSDVDA
jgi:hypothetical protein